MTEMPVGQVVPDYVLAFVVYAYCDETFSAEYLNHFWREAARFIKRHDLMRRPRGELHVNMLVADP